MTTWREVILGDLCERVTVGHVGKMANEYVSDGVPFLRSQNVRPFEIVDDGMLAIGETFHRKLAKSALKTGDVVVVRTGYPGTAAVVPESFDNANCADLVVITPGPDLNADLLAAIFNSAWGRSTVSGQLVGAAQQHFNVGSAKSLRLRVPDRATQDRIAAILCSLNDGVANARHRIQVLEKMAKATYREWFVRFRYPGHEVDSLLDSPLGRVPGGWEVKTLGDVAAVNRASRIPRAGESVVYLDISCLGDRSIDIPAAIDGSDAPGRARRVVTSGDVLWSMVRPNRRAHVLLVDPPSECIASTGLAVLSPTDVPSSFLFEAVSTRQFSEFLVTKESGAAYPAVRPSDFGSALIVVPPQGLLDKFEETVRPCHRLGWQLREESRTLSTLRDLLLPKLLTGQIDVSSLDLDGVMQASA